MAKWKLCPLAWIALFLFTAPVIRYLTPGWNLIAYPVNLIGLLGLAVGIVFFIWTGGLMGKYKTPRNYERSTKVITDGPFSFSRNPMYIGMTGFVLGYTLLFGNVIALAGPVLFFIILDRVFIPFEEQKMAEELGGEYLEYKKNVRRWL